MNQDKYHIDQIFSPAGDISAEQLLKYANNNLTHAEAHQVERTLVDSEFYEDAVEGMRNVSAGDFQAMMDRVNQRIKEKVSTSHDEEARTIPFTPQVSPEAPAAGPKKRNYFRLFSVAASVLLIAVAGYLFLRPNLSPSDIADAHFEVFEGNIVRGGMGITEASVYDRAKMLYNEKKYAEAAPLFDQVDSIQARYCSANCYYMIGKYDLAAERFRAVISMGDGYAEDAEFGLAMTLLKQNKVDDARSLLEDMSNDARHNYHMNAQAALGQVGQL